jgi:hypothetical protein
MNIRPGGLLDAQSLSKSAAAVRRLLSQARSGTLPRLLADRVRDVPAAARRLFARWKGAFGA